MPSLISMKFTSRTLTLATLLVCSFEVSAQEALPSDPASRAADARRAAEVSDPSITETATKVLNVAKDKLGENAEAASAVAPTSKLVKKGTTKSSVSDASDPTTWGKNDVRKLGVLEVKFGGSTETIVFELFDKDAPKTVGNFTDNAASRSYNGLAFHRTIDGYLVQTGDPLSSDEGARSSWGTGGSDKEIPAEIKRPHKLGAVAMARRSDKVNPNKKSNGFQFYFVLGNMSALDGEYTVFGQVVDGLEWLERISRVPADSNDCPLERIEIKSLKVVDQVGPLNVVRQSNLGRRRLTKPDGAKSSFERFLERVW